MKNLGGEKMEAIEYFESLRESWKKQFMEKAKNIDELKNKSDKELQELAEKFVDWRMKKLIEEYLRETGGE
jgi:wobble nucleotide-excising tRNase